jgi:SPP1 gp7 family putative phage head morphogenesis protein
MVTYLLGKYVAQNELKQTIRERVLKFAEFETDLFGDIDWAIVTPNSAIEAMRQVVEVTKAEGQMLSPLVEKHGIILGKGEADYIRGVWADTLQDAIKRGVPLNQFRNEISTAFDLAGITKAKPYHVEAIYRTNMSEAFVAGRMIEHDQNPMSREIFPALQYIAIVDERTRIDHAGMDNYVALRTDPIWQTWLPPNGWQCRCQVSFVDKWDIEDGYVKLETGERKLVGVPLSPDSGFAKGNQFYNTIGQVNKGTVVENYDILVKNAKKAILADYQKEAIHDYTGTRYAMLNKVILKNTIGFFPEMSELSLNLDSALSKLPEFNGVTYRGIKFGSIKESSEFLNKCLPGQSISFPSYTSTSIDKDIASKFLMTRTAKPGTRVLLEIRGKSGKVLNGWSWREIEKEILFGRGAKFNVVQLTTQENGINYLILEEI